MHVINAVYCSLLWCHSSLLPVREAPIKGNIWDGCRQDPLQRCVWASLSYSIQCCFVFSSTVQTRFYFLAYTCHKYIFSKIIACGLSKKASKTELFVNVFVTLLYFFSASTLSLFQKQSGKRQYSPSLSERKAGVCGITK